MSFNKTLPNSHIQYQYSETQMTKSFHTNSPTASQFTDEILSLQQEV